LGVKSLFGHTVGGAAGAVGRITGAMGNLINLINSKNIEKNLKLFLIICYLCTSLILI